MSLRDPKVQRILLTVVTTVIMLWGYFLSSILPFGYQPRSKETKELRAEYQQITTELEKARRTVGKLPQLERENAELLKKWEKAEALLPSDKEVSALLTQITRAGEQSGVRFEMFRPKSPKPREFYNENPIEIKVSAGYHQLGMFLSRLANLPRLVNVANLNLSSKKPDKEGRSPSDRTLSASFTANAYSLRNPSVVGNAAPAESGGRRGVPAKAPRTNKSKKSR